MVLLGSSLVFSPAADGAASESDWEQWMICMHCLHLWTKADCQTQSLQVVLLIQIFSHCALEKYCKIHWV